MNIENTQGGPEPAPSSEKRSGDLQQKELLEVSRCQSPSGSSPKVRSTTDPYAPSTPEETQTSYEKIANALVASGHGDVEALLHVLQLKSKTLADTARTQHWDVPRILTSIRRRTPVSTGISLSKRSSLGENATEPAPAAAFCNAGVACDINKTDPADGIQIPSRRVS